MVNTVKFENQIVPEFITKGNHTKFIEPFALEVCKGEGLDIGCNRQEWALKGSTMIDPVLNSNWHALSIPKKQNGWDYIFSSHCLEHVPNYVETLKYWTENLSKNGILFLYLPHPDCVYWRPWKMPTGKHIHQFYPEQLKEIFESLNYTNIFVSGRDLAYSFAIFGQKIN
jgi:predicted SAM-dependent methyltransferase